MTKSFPKFRIGNGYDTEYEDEDWFWVSQNDL